jgi:menaquinone-dependent protoporphyrinogen oxidase
MLDAMSSETSSPRVLVAAASRHGATAEIADALGRRLGEHGVVADVARLEDVEGLTGYDAFVLGSAVYVGRWLEPARRFVEANREELATRPTWLFSSGPLGDPLRPDEGKAVHVADLVESTGAVDHRLFPGRLRRDVLGFGERAIVAAVRAPDGDYRDWDAIAAWADGIAQSLQPADAGVAANL